MEQNTAAPATAQEVILSPFEVTVNQHNEDFKILLDLIYGDDVIMSLPERIKHGAALRRLTSGAYSHILNTL
jgi:hypothetical protein